MKRFIVIASVLLICAGLTHGEEADDLHKPALLKLPAAEIASQKKITEASAVLPQKLSAEAAAVWQFLARRAKDYRLSPDASNIQLLAEKESLLGKHYYFQQVLGGINVDQATLVVTTNRDGQVTKVYTSMIPVTEDRIARATKANKSVDEAFDVAWKTLGAQPEAKKGLYSDPKATLTYVPTKKNFQLAYAVDLHVNRKAVRADGNAVLNEPGLWRVYVDAVTGTPIGEPIKLSTDHKGKEVTYDKRAGDRSAAFQQYFKFKTAEKDKPAVPPGEAAETGSAQVFDPDPLTTLKDSSLNDNSPAAMFDLAYKPVALLEITKRDGKFFLEGPWVVIDDFETPRVANGRTTDGKWNFKRGNGAFNDAMTYFHIDRSQRYMQSLGFNNIQHGPIHCDADGLNGDDNSHFVPTTNTLAFGHGCIDDNEDADVILHEYGSPHYEFDQSPVVWRQQGELAKGSAITGQRRRVSPPSVEMMSNPSRLRLGFFRGMLAGPTSEPQTDGRNIRRYGKPISPTSHSQGTRNLTSCGRRRCSKLILHYAARECLVKISTRSSCSQCSA